MNEASQRRKLAERLGRYGEWLAIFALMTKGYSILARRVRTGAGEIDLIARRKNIIVFIEVKARRTETVAIESVTPKARQRITRSAELWMAKRPALQDYGWRFDIIAIVPRRWPKHISDAWRPDFAPSFR
jgi:putative endonuclease